MNFNLELKDKTIYDESLRWIEIYKITNNINQKIYIGQAISHIRKGNKLKPHGTIGRFNKHLQEALGNNKTKYSCKCLDESIRKYGSSNFTIVVLEICNQIDANNLESEWITKLDSLAPNGYNLTTTCKSYSPSIDFRKNISSGIITSLADKRIKRILQYNLCIEDNYENYVTPKYRNKIQVGWRIRLKDIVLSQVKIPANKEIEFTSELKSLDENKIRAIKFLKLIKECLNSNTTKLTGSSLEPSLPLIDGNIYEDHD